MSIVLADTSIKDLFSPGGTDVMNEQYPDGFFQLLQQLRFFYQANGEDVLFPETSHHISGNWC